MVLKKTIKHIFGKEEIIGPIIGLIGICSFLLGYLCSSWFLCMWPASIFITMAIYAIFDFPVELSDSNIWS